MIYFLHYKNYSYELKKELLLSSYIKGINLADAHGNISIKEVYQTAKKKRDLLKGVKGIGSWRSSISSFLTRKKHIIHKF